MLYTFELTESQLDRVDQYLQSRWAQHHREYILAVQHRVTDDLVIVIVDCTEEAAVWITLIL